MLVMGGIIGAGIFVNPAEVARHVDTPGLIVGVWLIGGADRDGRRARLCRAGARRPEVGGQYAYLRDAWGPVPAFLYGWSLLLVIQSGGMAAVAITFARYFVELTPLPAPRRRRSRPRVLALLMAINCLGVRAGRQRPERADGAQDRRDRRAGAGGLVLAPAHPRPRAGPLPTSAARHALRPIGAAMTPVMFAYGGWQTSSFVAGEMRDPRRDLARGLLLGVAGVVLLYTAVAFVCVYVLGPAGLAESATPAAGGDARSRSASTGADPDRARHRHLGARLPQPGHADDAASLFRDGRGRPVLPPGRRGECDAPVCRSVAILLQGAAAIAIALSGTYGQILSYVVSVDFIWFGLTGAALFVFRRRDRWRRGLSSAGPSLHHRPVRRSPACSSSWRRGRHVPSTARSAS